MKRCSFRMTAPGGRAARVRGNALRRIHDVGRFAAAPLRPGSRSPRGFSHAISTLFCCLILFLPVWKHATAVAGVPDWPFLQEVHKPFLIGQDEKASDVRSVLVDRQGVVWVASASGVFRLAPSSTQWEPMLPPDRRGPCFDLCQDAHGRVWVAAWDGLYVSDGGQLRKAALSGTPVAVLCTLGEGIAAFGPDGAWIVTDSTVEDLGVGIPRSVRDAVVDGEGGLWLATDVGLFHWRPYRLRSFQGEGQLLSARVTSLDYADDGSLWIGGLGGITVYRAERRVYEIRPHDGLPNAFVQCIRRGPDGRMWVGTRLGVARFDGRGWSVRHSRRWLLSDDVRDIAFSANGTAWVATARGVSAIQVRKMTLAEKAGHYLRVLYRRHVRQPYLVEKCRLLTPGDTTHWEPRDDDNDGQYTSMYLAMESFRYAATGDPSARRNAKNAFEALRFLQTVTETPGFVARTVIPAIWPRMADPNREIPAQEWAELHVDDPRYKPVEKRWRLSRDGKWLWKGDTSSDEITGHMFGYLFYYDLVADEEERARVREHVCRIVDYIIDGGYVLRDIDGEPTRWGVWCPQKLNGDPDWAPERGVNSVEILSFLKLAFHVSGDAKYEREYRRLLFDFGYAENVRYAKTYDPAWRTHIDDELLALAYPCLFLHERDPQLRALYRQSLDFWYEGAREDCSPFFDFIYAMCTGCPVQLERDVAWLRDAPLDLVRWRVDNSRREDLDLVRWPEMEQWQTSRLLPPSERETSRWDGNPWSAVQGDGGWTEGDGVFWLLPYWMGRYYGWIGPPENARGSVQNY